MTPSRDRLLNSVAVAMPPRAHSGGGGISMPRLAILAGSAITPASVAGYLVTKGTTPMSSRRVFPAMRAAASWPARVRIAISALLLATALAAHATFAASGVVPSAAERWKAECGTCHIAYPPKLLAASTWRAIMSGLETHFGADASVDAATAAAMGAYLEQHAGKERRASAATLRITDTPWFRREHDEVSRAVWTRPAIKSASNCAACHTEADSGDFRERNIRIPR
jgi:hypothetical protein